MNKNTKIALGIIAIVSIVKLLFIALSVFEVQTFENHVIASNFLKNGTLFYFHEGNIDYNNQFPLYGLILSGIYWLFGIKLKVVLILNVLLNGISLFLLYKITERVTKRQAISLVTLIICALHPFIFFYSISKVHPFSMDLFVLVLGIHFAISYKIKSFKRALYFGLFIGISILERASLSVLIFPLLIINWTNFKLIIQQFSVLTIGVLFVISPWIIRNKIQTGEYSLNSNIHKNLWLGSQTETNGTANLISGESYFELIKKEEPHFSHWTLQEKNDWFKNKYIEYWISSPKQQFKMLLIRAKNFWTLGKHSGVNYNHNSLFKALYGSFYFCVFFLFLVSILKKKTNYQWAILSVIFGVFIIQTAFYVETRHRVLIECLMIIMACSTFVKKNKQAPPTYSNV